MTTELIIQKPNLLKNWNFNENNITKDIDGITDTQIWITNNLWNLNNGVANCVSSNGNALEQLNVVKINKEYIISFNIISLTGTINLFANGVGYSYTTTGVKTLTFTPTTNVDIAFTVSLTGSASIGWVKLLENPSYYNVDLSEDVVMPLTFSVADIKDPSKRNASFSKTIQIPGTKNNNIIFNHIFEIGGDCTFNPNKKIKAILYADGEQQLNGYLQLKNINRTLNSFDNYDLINYEVILIGGVTDIYTAMKDDNLSDLTFNEYNHEYTLSNIINSWKTSIIKNGSSYNNFINGASKNVTSVQVTSDGRVQLNFATSHGLSVNEQIYVEFTHTNALGYNGDHRVFKIVNTTSVVLFYPYIAGTGTLTGTNIAYSHQCKGEGYVYPMLYLGKHNDNTNHDGINWKVSDFTPSIYLKEYVNKIAKKYGYILNAPLFDNADFKRLILTASVKEFKPTKEQLNHRAFQSSKTTSTTGSYTFTGLNTATMLYKTSGSSVPLSDVIFNNDSTAPNFDNESAFNVSTGRWTCVSTGNYDLNCTYKYSHTKTLPTGVQLFGAGFETFQIRTQLFNYTTNTVVSVDNLEVVFMQYSNITNKPVNVSFKNIQIKSGDVYGIKMSIFVPSSTAFTITPTPTSPSTLNITTNWQIDAGMLFFNSPNDVQFADGDTIDIINAVPKMKCKDFFTTLIKIFNLYVDVDRENEKILNIYPRNDYYDFTDIQNWTKKLDTQKDMIIQPMAELSAKEYQFNFKADKAILNEDHLKENGYGYGDTKILIDNDFLTATNKIELNVASGVLLEFPTGSNRIITGIYADSNGAHSKIDAEPRILYFSVDSCNTTNKYNIISTISNDSVYGLTTYPYAGHLDKVRGPKYDYNFFYPSTIEFVSNQWTSANLYNRYYKDMINEITSQNNKLITMYIYLKNSDISNLNFRSIYLIDGHYLRLNKITDYNPGSTESTKCEFIKVENSLKYVQTYMSSSNTGPTFGENTLDGDTLPNIKSYSQASSYSNYTISDFGFGNEINTDGTSQVFITGNNNNVGSNVTNATINNSNNVTIYGGLSNVYVVNTDNVTVTQSNTTIINGLLISSNGSFINTNINLINAGINEVLNPFNTVSTINLVNAGINEVLNPFSNVVTNLINAGNDIIL